jgi:diadenosine tetraphosphate (Ap4A) HIT family hydrolase
VHSTDTFFAKKIWVHDRVTLYCLIPATKGNLLILPKRHIERFEQLTAEEMGIIQGEVNLFARVFEDFYGPLSL